MPKFPFRRSVAGDLSDLWAGERVERQARHLGLSSMAQGDGSLDLVTEGGATVARVGDGPDGEFGLLVPGGATGWRRVQDDAQARVDAARATLEGSISSLSSTVSSHGSSISSLSSSSSSQSSRIAALESELAAARGSAASLAVRLLAMHAANMQTRAHVNIILSRLKEIDPGGSYPPPLDTT